MEVVTLVDRTIVTGAQSKHSHSPQVQNNVQDEPVLIIDLSPNLNYVWDMVF
jgi:hypothetical protein